VRVQRRIVLAVAISVCLLALAVPARSQPQVPPRSAKQALAQAQARFQVSVMEGVLERAVENAAQVLNIQLRPMMPELFMWGSAARARGFRLEGYGVFFDVEVPMVRQSYAWSLQLIGRPDDALKALHDYVRTITDAKQRDQLDRALRQIEIQFPASGATQASGSGAAPKAAQTAPIDPDEAYTTAVTSAIVDSMLDHSGPLAIGNDEWLTVAARDYEGQRGVAPDAPYELVTIVMRIKGSDLQAFRAGRLSREEARKRVELREF
jgi:hypothetical protein